MNTGCNDESTHYILRLWGERYSLEFPLLFVISPPSSVTWILRYCVWIVYYVNNKYLFLQVDLLIPTSLPARTPEIAL